MNINMNPALLMSIVNTALRDNYDNLESFCDDKDIDIDELINKLSEAGYKYNSEISQFR